MGYGKDDVIGIVAKNHHLLAPIVFASIAIAAPLNPIVPQKRMLPSKANFTIRTGAAKISFVIDNLDSNAAD